MLNDLIFILPEIIILVTACLILVTDLYIKVKNGSLVFILCLLGLLAATYSNFYLINTSQDILSANQAISDSPNMFFSIFNQSYAFDFLSILLKTSFLFMFAIVLVYSKKYLVDRKSFSSEYVVLSLISLLGMMILVSSTSLLTLYLGLELFALPLYALIAYVRENKLGVEASMKYFILGGLASGLFLYGVSLIYGVTGTTNIQLLNAIFAASDFESTLVLQFGMMFAITGIAFKLGAAPFHMWVPDTYHGASTPVTLLISSIPKIAGFGMAVRILAGGFLSLSPDWQPFIMVMAVLSLAIGNIAAIVQTNLKRLLAYSTISHVGFLLLAIVTAPETGFGSGLFYIMVYAISTLAAFGIIIVLSHKGFEADKIEDLKGLGTTNPVLAFMMLLVMFSLAGVPPLVGFYAKFLILRDLLTIGLFELAITAIIFSVIGAFYYLRIVKVMFFDKPSNYNMHATGMGIAAQSVLAFNSFLLLLLGIFPAQLASLCFSVF